MILEVTIANLFDNVLVLFWSFGFKFVVNIYDFIIIVMLNSEFQICLQLNFLRMSAKMDAVATKLDGAAKTQDISNSIAKTIPQLQKCMKDMSVEDMTGTFYFLKMISSY